MAWTTLSQKAAHRRVACGGSGSSSGAAGSANTSMISGLQNSPRAPQYGCRPARTDTSTHVQHQRNNSANTHGSSTTGIARVTPEDAFAALMEGRTIFDLAEGLQLRRVRVMGANRIELSGFSDTMRQRLTAYGLYHEIISWKLRMFVPVDASGPAVLAKLFDRWPVERIGEREAA